MSDPTTTCASDTPAPSASSKWILFGIAILVLLPTSGILDPYPLFLKIDLLVIGALSLAGFKVQSTSLQAAHVAGQKLAVKKMAAAKSAAESPLPES